MGEGEDTGSRHEVVHFGDPQLESRVGRCGACEEEFLRTAHPIDIGGVTVPVIGPEELIVTKVLAGRAKDLDDVRGILLAQGEALDLTRVRTLIRALEAALDQSDLLPCFEKQRRAVRSTR